MRESVINNFKRLDNGLAKSKSVDDFCEKIPKYFSHIIESFGPSAGKFLEVLCEKKIDNFRNIAGLRQNFYGMNDKYIRASRLFDALLDMSFDIFTCENLNGKLKFDFNDYEGIRREFIEKYSN